jgi:hypothetical protein
VALIWQPTAEGFVIRPAIAPNQALSNSASPIATRTETWLTTGTQAAINTATRTNLVVLGPEPILAPARITLSVATSNSAKPFPTLSIGTDGLRPFQVVP